MNFKDILNRDLKTVFFNANEHAEKAKIEYNGKKYNIPVVTEYEGAKDRRRISSDHANGIFISDMTLYIAFSDLKILPRKETIITINGENFKVVKPEFSQGMITLALEVLEE
ncbi:MAG: hypothetical protein FWH05_08685 [Oscillospiraceae bacterium]|nr:hypothetical protein [Oscillospiraceae bacterium]